MRKVSRGDEVGAFLGCSDGRLLQPHGIGQGKDEDEDGDEDGDE